VTIRTLIPALLQFEIASGTSFRTGSSFMIKERKKETKELFQIDWQNY